MKNSILLLLWVILIASSASSQTIKTVGSGGDYTTLKNAFDAINAGTITGSITLRITGSITDNNTAVINASGTGSASYTSLLIYPTGTGYTLTGAVSGPIISLNGADDVVIDGRVNATGSAKDLVITNTNTGTGSSTVRFTNSAENNTVKFCVLKGSGTNVQSGIILFSTSASGNGNDNNLIDHNDITGDPAGRPVNVICTSGTSGRENSTNTISNNNIYNFFRAASNSTGIYIYSNSTDWTVSGNSFYETTTIVPTAANTYYGINISTATAHTVSGNYFGGSAPQCGGAPWTMNSNSGHFFYVLYINGGSASPVLVQNNTIQNINYTTVHRNPWDGIYLASGLITVTGNTIGATTGTGSIVVTIPNASATATISGGVVTAINLVGGGSGFTTPPAISFSQSGSTTAASVTANISGGSVTGFNILNGGAGYTSAPTVMFVSADYSTTHGIRHATSGTATISNNHIGSITTVGSETFSHCFEGIVISGAASLVNITGNVIGSESTANSIQAVSTAATSVTKQDVRGIYVNSTVTSSTITGNIISNLNNAYSGNIASRTDAICTSGGSNTIQNNIVSKLTANSSAVLLKGIQQVVTTTGTDQVVTGNTIHDLSNTSSTGTVVVTGIQYSGPITLSNKVSSNFVHGLTLSSSNTNSEIDGIVLGGGVVTCANNIINLGAGVTTGYKIYGIYDNSSGIASNNSNVYFNSVYLAGTVTAGVTSSTAALWNSNNNCIRNYRNNVLVNLRSGGTSGKHYGIRVSGNGGLTIDYNDYYVSGGGMLGNIAGADKATLALWKTATGQDINSLNTDPVFTVAGGTDPLNYNTSAVIPGVTGTGISTDYHGITRGVTPKMGALETNGFVWVGSISSDFGTAGNWAGGIVPTADADISFAASPANNCVLDQSRSLDDITNAQSSYKLVTNGKQLTIKGVLYFSNGAQINATSASSEVVFAGSAAQVIPAGAFVGNTFQTITLNNTNGLTVNDDLTISQGLTLASGAFAIGAHTLTINGEISLTAGSFTGGISSNIIFGGSAATVMPAITLNNLTINCTGGITLAGDVSVGGTLTLSDGALTVGAHTLTISGTSPVRTSGYLNAAHASASVVFGNVSAITLPAGLFTGSITNLTISGSGGVIAGSDLTVNGILNLAASNPSATKGLLEMTIDYTNYPGTTNSDYLNSYILNMGATAITTGIGDVTGTIRRATILENTPYTFGHQYTTVALTAGTMPDALSVTVTIGATPSGNPDAVKRVYEIVPEVPGGYTSTSHVTANFHYLDNELTSSISPYHVNSEPIMVTMDYDIGGGFGTPDEHGRSAYDFTNKFIGLSNIPVSYFINIPGHDWRTIFQLKDFNTGYYTWDGSTSSDWGTSTNWTPAGVPSDLSHVIIPDAVTTPNDPVLPSGVTINTLMIERGGILEMGNETLTIKNSLSGGWEDQNTQGNDPGTSTVIFSMPGTTISGNARFYNVIIADGADITNHSGSTMKIANTITRQGSGKWYADVFDATIEYNGGNQTVVTTDVTPYYHKLVLSGNGTKTLPAAVMTLHGDLVLQGTVTATAADPLTINGNLIIESGATFSTGNFNHIINGNIENSGNFITIPGYNITMNGTSPQSILGDSTSVFDNLILTNSNGAGIYSDVSVNNTLTLGNGILTVGPATIGINGTISRTSGKLDVSGVSSLYFGGTSAVNLSADLFAITPVVNNLTINNTAGVVMNTDFTVNNTLLNQQGELQIANGKSLTSLSEFVNSSSGVLINNGSLYIKGNVTNGQTAMAPGSGTVYFNGLLEQTVGGTQAFIVNNLVTDNAAGFVLNNNLGVSGVHTFSAGVLTTSATPNYLIYQSGASYSGNSDGAHVNGWVKKLGSTDFIFPVGNGTYSRSIGITGVSGASEFNAVYNRPVTPNTTQMDDSLVFINSSEYWTINKISGANANVTMNWDNSKIAFPQLRLTDIRAAYYDGIRWNSLGGSATGDVLTTGTVTSTTVSAMNNYYTLGSISFVLPMHLISFTARRNAEVTDVDWKVDEEQNVRQYELERSDDGIYFYTIYRQWPRNLNGVELYSYSDRKAVSSTVFYRLKITTSSSKVIYSQIVVISVNTHKNSLRIITNPVQDKIDIYASDQAAGQYWYSIISTSGQVMQSGSLEVKYSGVYSIPLRSTLSTGVYCIQMQSEVNSLKQLIIKK